jgi:hypothetical protein
LGPKIPKEDNPAQHYDHGHGASFSLERGTVPSQKGTKLAHDGLEELSKPSKVARTGMLVSPSSDTTVPSSSGSSSGGSDSLDSSVSDDEATVVLVPEQVPASICPTDSE